MKTTTILWMIAMVLFIGPGCTDPGMPRAGEEQAAETARVTLTIPIPDYHNHIFQAAEPARSRVIDPANASLEITVSAADMGTISATFDFSQVGVWVPEWGFGYADCTIEGVPLGMDRLFQAVTKDAEGNSLSSAESNVDINAGSTDDVVLWLHPLAVTPIVADTPLTTQTVAYGQMVYYKLDTPTSGNYRVTLTSAADDVDLYVYNDLGSSYEENDFWEVGIPTEENAYIFDDYDFTDDFFYLAVFGNSDTGSDNLFDIEVETFTGTSFGTLQANLQTPGTWNSISATGTALWTEEDYWIESKSLLMDFPFTFHGELYQTLYISQHGYISFWPYSTEDPPHAFSSLPANYIALYGTRLDLELDLGENIYYAVQGSEPNRMLVIEYNAEENSDPTQRLQGQIVLHENGDIELLYNHAVCTILDDAVAGLVNADFSDLSLLMDLNGVPPEDILFNTP